MASVSKLLVDSVYIENWKKPTDNGNQIFDWNIS